MVSPVAVNPDMDSKNASSGERYPPREKGNEPMKVRRSQPKAAILKASSSPKRAGVPRIKMEIKPRSNEKPPTLKKITASPTSLSIRYAIRPGRKRAIPSITRSIEE
jgi:hypothetical protein